MQKPVQNLATGFLSLLGLKSFGRNPSEMHEQLQPTIDMTQWYLGANAVDTFRSDLPSDPVNPLSGFAAGVQVPQEQNWWIHEAQVVLDWAVGPITSNVYNLATAVSLQQPGYLFRGEAMANFTTAMLTVNTNNLAPPAIRNVWARPGSLIGAHASLIAISDATPVQVWTLRTYVRYTAVQI